MEIESKMSLGQANLFRSSGAEASQSNQALQKEAADPKKMQDKAEPAEDSQTLKVAVDDINRIVEAQNRQLRFNMDESSGKPVITVLDSETDKVIREIPSEEVRRLASRVRELQQELGQATGLILNKRV
ncbi:flagellar protein FlaG [Balneatrix alpica]|uniref:flagellar protein FlaG n=1 Tax=Balneatrix alpica TaxID=75684 RepID=UPI0027395E71|nr:flagellar protein FlaG [Balneatrix alpica]